MHTIMNYSTMSNRTLEVLWLKGGDEGARTELLIRN